MKTAISLPDSVFEDAEALAQQLDLSRSELYEWFCISSRQLTSVTHLTC